VAIENPLPAAARADLAKYLNRLVEQLAAELDDGPAEADLVELAIDAAEWQRRHRDALDRLRRAANQITGHTLTHQIARETEQLLAFSDDKRLGAARQALRAALERSGDDPAVTDAERVARETARHGFHIQTIPAGAGQQPVLVCTSGLPERAGHPELVIVDESPALASVILRELGDRIITRGWPLQPEEKVTALLQGGQSARVSELDPRLLARLPARPDSAPAPLQIRPITARRSNPATAR
jgi:hypothetical protein